MNCDHKKYTLSESAKRMDSAIQRAETAVCITDSIADSESTENNTYQTAYVNATVLSLVIHSDLCWEDQNAQLELSLGYKMIFQETIMLLRDCSICKSYFIDGMHIIAVFDTPQKSDVKTIIDLSARICSLIDIWRFKRGNNQCDFLCSIGIHYGRLLKFDEEDLVHRGGKNIYLGVAMQKANQLSYQPMPDKWSSCIRLSSVAFQNLYPDYQNLFHWDMKYDSYRSTLYNVEMKKWLKEKEAKG